MTADRDSALLRWLFLAPTMLGIGLFVVLPIVGSLALAFFRWDIITSPQFVGLENYRDMLADPAFRSSLVTFVVFAAIVVPLTFAGSLALAVLVNGVRRFQAFFRSVFFLPLACSYVAASLIWRGSIFPGVPTGVANTALRADIRPYS